MISKRPLRAAFGVFFVALLYVCSTEIALADPLVAIFMADAKKGRGQVPYQTDGTSAGTVPVPIPYRASSTYVFYPTAKSITIWSYYPGGNAYNLDFLDRIGKVSTWRGCPGCILQNFHQVGSDLYFVASPPGSSDVIYKTSGTIASTVAICSVSPTCGIPNPAILSSVFIYSGQVYYSFVEFSGQTLVYTSSGSTFNLAFGASNAGQSYNDLHWDSQVGNQIIFANSTPSQGSELWATDGTQAGRHLVKSFYGGQTSGLLSNPSIPSQVFTIDGKAMIIADDPSYGPGLWLTDGTVIGTKRLNLSQTDAFRIYQNYGRWSQIVGSKLYFTTSDIDRSRFMGLGQSLYTVDDSTGAVDPTLIKLVYQNYEVMLMPDASFAITPSGWLYTNGIQVNTATCHIRQTPTGPNVVGAGCDEQLFRINLTTQVVQAVADPYVNNAQCSGGCDEIMSITAHGNDILFAASDKRYYTKTDHSRIDNPQPWFSKGYPGSSLKLKDIASYLNGGSQPYQFMAMP